jgi:hypothetical protein
MQQKLHSKEESNASIAFQRINHCKFRLRQILWRKFSEFSGVEEHSLVRTECQEHMLLIFFLACAAQPNSAFQMNSSSLLQQNSPASLRARRTLSVRYSRGETGGSSCNYQPNRPPAHRWRENLWKIAAPAPRLALRPRTICSRLLPLPSATICFRRGQPPLQQDLILPTRTTRGDITCVPRSKAALLSSGNGDKLTATTSNLPQTSRSGCTNPSL